MIQLVDFLVGQQYENRKGAYEVLQVYGDTMRIRWDDGEEVDTSVIMQSHIIHTMQRESERLARNIVAPLLKEGAAPNGWQRTRR